MWVAIAIHDVSSVVEARVAYGDEALKMVTTVELTWALVDYCADNLLYSL